VRQWSENIFCDARSPSTARGFTVLYHRHPHEKKGLTFTLRGSKQVVLTLHTLGGLYTQDVARAFLVPV